jgi:hypothetical protein
MERRWKDVARTPLDRPVSINPPMVMALVDGFIFIFIPFNHAIFEQGSQ